MEELINLEVLYEDNHLIAVDKPVGLLIQEDASGDPSLLDAVRHYLKGKYHKPGKVYLGLIHRLDRPVGGVVLLGRTSKGSARLSEQFREHSVEKTYHALVEGTPPASGRWEHHLEDRGLGQAVGVVGAETPGAKRAVLSFRTLQQGAKFALVEVKLETGRKHQIRAQFAAMGHPLAGDHKYGGRIPFGADGIGLVAYSLAFSHPTRPEERIVVQVRHEPRQTWAAWL